MEKFDVIVIGAGMAGLSAAYELSEGAKVLVLEREDYPGYHATGRSAALYASTYGSEKPVINALTKTSEEFFRHPPDNFSDEQLLKARGGLFVVHQERRDKLVQFYNELSPVNSQLQQVDSEFIKSRIPILKPEYEDIGVYDEDVFEIDVHALQEGYLRGFRQRGGALVTKFEVTGIEYADDNWAIKSNEGGYIAPVIVNAAGAWVDEIAQLAGINPIGIQPLRRSAILVDPPAGVVVDDWPMVIDVEENFYFKPDAGKILASSANENLDTPSDVQPDEMDIAEAAYYVSEATSLDIKRIDHSWAGLRSFVEDRSMVIGFEPGSKGFFWLAGQGGYGIQTAPSAGRLAASLILQNSIPEDLTEYGLDKTMISPARLSRGDA